MVAIGITEFRPTALEMDFDIAKSDSTIYPRPALHLISMEDIDVKIRNLTAWVETEARAPWLISSKLDVKDVEGSGRGVYAAQPIVRSETLIRMPLSLLLNFTTVVRHITSHNKNVQLREPYYLHIRVPPPQDDDISSFYSTLSLDTLLGLLSFQLVSMYLILEKQHKSFWSPFLDMLPSLDELLMVPLVWKVLQLPDWEALFRLLPRSARKHADLVVDRFEKDWKVVSGLVPSHFINRSTFLWAWMCINSRCLYMEMPQAKDASDNFTMAPYVDFLNHLNDDQCGIKIDTTGFHVVTSSSYSAGDQLYFSYGPHSNEFLLCEYGFTLPNNRWNYVDVTDYIVPLLRLKQVDYLKAYDYYGDYTVNEEGMSFRTEIALAVLQEADPDNSGKLKALVGGLAEGTPYERKSKALLQKILEKLIHDCDRSRSGETARERAVGALYADMKRIAEAVVKSFGTEKDDLP